jgi:ATP-binding cassette subfamily B protein/subfamily B ATP-binding cassette protein MsbA
MMGLRLRPDGSVAKQWPPIRIVAIPYRSGIMDGATDLTPGGGILKTLLFVLTYARRYLKPLTIAVVSMVFLVAVRLLAPQVIRQLIAMVSAGAGAEAQPQVLRLAAGLLILYALRGVMQFLSGYMAHSAGWGVVADIRRTVYQHIQKLSLRFYSNQQTGHLMSRVINDTELFEHLISHAVPDLLVNLLMLAGVLAVMFSMNPTLALLTMAPVPLIGLAMRGFGKYVRPAFRERQAALSELNASLNDSLSGIREIKSFTQEDTQRHRMSHHIDRYRDSMLKALRLMAMFGPLIEFASSLGTIVVIYFGGKLAFGKTLSIEDLVAFFLYLELFYQPVRVLGGVWERVQESLAGADRISELLDEQPDVDDAPDARSLPGRAEGALQFRDVSFAYEQGESVLEHIELEIPAGKVLALVGPTGVGKTTLASLIPRFYDATEGALLLDGVDIRELWIEDLRRQISMVLQDVFLFNGTVRENILFGRLDATEEELMHAAQVANAHDFIMRLPEGYDTAIGERGVKLSGGQKQRISIARAVLKDAPILVLDEATSSVDTETELLIQQALERLMVGRTTVVIAHRLSTVRNADQIVVLEGKGISQRGTHEELISQDGLYQHLWGVQGQLATLALSAGQGELGGG